jgi:lipopolysaccharide/colanic/teichoic acid biosynthesis glycosyltransferase
VLIDRDYVDNWRPRRDLAIAMRTVSAVITRRGAH